jgi:hypothetical protein
VQHLRNGNWATYKLEQVQLFPAQRRIMFVYAEHNSSRFMVKLKFEVGVAQAIGELLNINHATLRKCSMNHPFENRRR